MRKHAAPIAALTLLAPALLAVAGCDDKAPAPAPPPPPPAAATAAVAKPATAQLDAPRIAAAYETDAVNTEGDAADDPAIWVDPADPARSLVIGTAKKSGLYTYGLDGKTVQFVPEGRLNNVDVRTMMLDGKETIVVGASDRDRKGIALFRLDPATRQLSSLGERIPSGFADPYGFCFYKSISGALYAFMTDKERNAAQWRIDVKGGKVTGTRVRDLPLATQSEGCVADDASATVYIAEEEVGVWSFPAEPGEPAIATAVFKVAENAKLAADMEGLAIYHGAGGSYLLVSSQGNSSYAVFGLGESHEYKGSFIVTQGIVDGTSETDGIDVTSAPLGLDFPKGLFVAQDGDNTDPPANQNFKLVSWEHIAGALKLP